MSSENPKIARRKPVEQLKKIKIDVVITAKQKGLYKLCAAQNDMSFSEWVRFVLNSAVNDNLIKK